MDVYGQLGETVSQSTTIQVLDRWPLVLRPGTGGHYQYLDTASKRNAACFLNLVEDLPSGLTVVEHFGGVGMFSTIIEQVLRPRWHIIGDIDDDCAKQLAATFEAEPHVSVTCVDAKETMGLVPAQLVVLDFAYATIKHHGDWPWAHVVEAKPRYIVFADTALRRLGLHRELYSRLFGCPIVTHEDYVNAYSRYLWAHYGYSVTREAHHVYSYMRLEPTPPGIVQFTKV